MDGHERGGTRDQRLSVPAARWSSPTTTSIGDLDSLEGNPVLTDVTALYGLTHVGNDVIVVGNVSLTDAAAQALADEIDTIGGSVTISGNE
jgi:hypothetical protein